ncbi:hypothetical protein BDV12DRAFT_196322 [Aspergillus spectabilis]
MATNTPFPDVPYSRIPPGRRRNKMKVLAFGLPRTGTMSLAVALNELGYNCYHMTECCFNHRSDSLLDWLSAIGAKYNGEDRPYKGVEFDKMLWRYDAVTDFPCILFIEELMDAYPDAQIILTTRFTDGWLPSLQRAFSAILGMKRLALLRLFDVTYINPAIALLCTSLSIITGTYRNKGNWKDPENLLAAYEAHNAHVRGAAQARGRRVLEYQVEEGWAPLCRSLNKPQPATPFPRVSEGGFVKQYQYIVFWYRLVELGWPMGLLVVLFYVFIWGLGVHVQLFSQW